MKIDELIKGLKTVTSKERIYNYIIQHPDEVYAFSYNEDSDKTLQTAFPELSPNTIDFYLSTLAKEKRIGKITIGRRVYSGSNEAIEKLRGKLSKVNDPTE